MLRILTAVLAIAFGIIVLLGYFFPEQAQLNALRLILVNWAIIIAGIAVLVGVFNLAAVQMEKFRTRQKGSGYSILLVISLVSTVVAWALGSLFGFEAEVRRYAMDAVILPAEASLMAILAVTLVYASIRLLRRRVDVMSIVFLIAVVVFLVTAMPTPLSALTPVQDLVSQFMGMLSGGGARGLLIGIALGTLLTGLRVLLGVDRPYGGN